jgi:hypothetical protein
MYAVIRSYSGHGTPELFDRLAQSDGDVETLFKGIDGFVSYMAVRTGEESGTTVTICRDKAGADESSRLAAEWVVEHVGVSGNPPAVSEGSSVLDFGA